MCTRKGQLGTARLLILPPRNARCASFGLLQRFVTVPVAFTAFEGYVSDARVPSVLPRRGCRLQLLLLHPAPARRHFLPPSAPPPSAPEDECAGLKDKKCKIKNCEDSEKKLKKCKKQCKKKKLKKKCKKTCCDAGF